MAVDTWSHAPKELYNAQELAETINATVGIEGVTVLGGEPFEQAGDLNTLFAFLDERLSKIVFTGFELGDLESLHDTVIDSIISMTDVLVDGEYIAALHDLSRPMVGSTNQRFHFLSNRYTLVDFPSNQIEVRLMKDGTALINGNGHIKLLTTERSRKG